MGRARIPHAPSPIGADMTLDDLDERQRAALVKRINRACNPDLRLRTCREDSRAFAEFGRRLTGCRPVQFAQFERS